MNRAQDQQTFAAGRSLRQATPQRFDGKTPVHPVSNWGFGGSPLVWEELLIWTVGAHGLAVRAQDGKVVWKSAPRPSAVWSNEPVGVSGYSTPESVESGGQRLVSLSNENQWLLVDPASGTVAWTTPWEVPYGVNAAQPTVVHDRVVLSGGYGYAS